MRCPDCGLFMTLLGAIRRVEPARKWLYHSRCGIELRASHSLVCVYQCLRCGRMVLG